MRTGAQHSTEHRAGHNTQHSTGQHSAHSTAQHTPHPHHIGPSHVCQHLAQQLAPPQHAAQDGCVAAAPNHWLVLRVLRQLEARNCILALNLQGWAGQLYNVRARQSSAGGHTSHAPAAAAADLEVNAHVAAHGSDRHAPRATVQSDHCRLALTTARRVRLAQVIVLIVTAGAKPGHGRLRCEQARGVPGCSCEQARGVSVCVASRLAACAILHGGSPGAASTGCGCWARVDGTARTARNSRIYAAPTWWRGCARAKDRPHSPPGSSGGGFNRHLGITCVGTAPSSRGSREERACDGVRRMVRSAAEAALLRCVVFAAGPACCSVVSGFVKIARA
jgi:hypothetical protein